jgi:hypothetical protein
MSNDEKDKPSVVDTTAKQADWEPEIVPIGKVTEVTHGGGRVWGDGQKNQERQ